MASVRASKVCVGPLIYVTAAALWCLVRRSQAMIQLRAFCEFGGWGVRMKGNPRHFDFV